MWCTYIYLLSFKFRWNKVFDFWNEKKKKRRLQYLNGRRVEPALDSNRPLCLCASPPSDVHAPVKTNGDDKLRCCIQIYVTKFLLFVCRAVRAPLSNEFRPKIGMSSLENMLCVATDRKFGVLHRCYTAVTQTQNCGGITGHLDRKCAAFIILFCVGVRACWLDDQPDDIGNLCQEIHV